MELQNSLTASLKMGYTFTSVLDMTLKIWWWGFGSFAGALGNSEYPLYAIAPMSTLARSGSNW